MERHAKFIVVSCFVIFSLAGLLLFQFWISAPSASAQSFKHKIIFNGAVSGLSVGSDVRYLGVSIGKVTAIAISDSLEGHVEVDFSTEAFIPHHKLVAQLEPQGITGLSIVELRINHQQQDTNSNRDTIPGYPSIISQLSGSASTITGSANNIVVKIDHLLSPQALQQLSNTITQLDQTTSHFAQASKQLSGLLSNIEQTSHTLQQTLAHYNNIGQKIDTQLLPNLDKTSLDLAQASQQANHLISDNRQSINKLFAEDIPTLMGLSHQLSQSLQSIEQLSSQLEDNPSSLIYGKQLPEVELAQ